MTFSLPPRTFNYLAHVESSYHVMVRVNAKKLRAVIVASRASHVKTLRDLKGKSIANPDALSLGTALVLARLRDAGLRPGSDGTIVQTPSHNTALITAFVSSLARGMLAGILPKLLH